MFQPLCKINKVSAESESRLVVLVSPYVVHEFIFCLNTSESRLLIFVLRIKIKC